MRHHPADRRAQPVAAPTRRLPTYQVILHRFTPGDLMHVVRTVMELTRYYRTEAMLKMWQAHHFGQARLLTTHRERAELYVEQFAEKGLTVSIEPSP